MASISHARNAFVAILLSLTLVASVFACAWDYDTLAMERQRFPNALELITGKFLRHSREFYEWRVQDREKRILESPSPNLYDDLGVAYDKLGEHAKAIDLMLQKEQLYPGLYETRANLGTFYIHAGQLEQGVEQIELAIEINPDAHFGREIYQKHLVNYVLTRKVDGELKLPLVDYEHLHSPSATFPDYIWHLPRTSTAIETEEDVEADDSDRLKPATKGILGMMRFGNYDSPILLEALGDLLQTRSGYSGDAKRLAARAYLKASYEVKDDATKIAYRSRAEECLSLQTVRRNVDTELSLEELEETFKGELAEADEWYEEISTDEKRWIAEDRNVDEAFSQKYYSTPELTPSPELRAALPIGQRILIALGILLLGFIGFIVAVWKSVVWLKRRFRRRSDSTVA